MAFISIINYLMDEEEREANRNLLRNLRQELRDTQDPFSIPDVAFVSLYRMPKVLVHELIAKLEPHKKVAQRNTAIPHHIQVLSLLSVVAKGKIYNSIIYSLFFIILSI